MEKQEIKTNQDMLEKLQEFCKMHKVHIKHYEVVRNHDDWKIVLAKK